MKAFQSRRMMASDPCFTLTVLIEKAEAGAAVSWIQSFDENSVADQMAPIVEPANEQVLDKLQRLVAESLGSVPTPYEEQKDGWKKDSRGNYGRSSRGYSLGTLEQSGTCY